MHIGVDFGTTRTIVSLADRGNYPIVQFADQQGDIHEFIPSLIAWDKNRLRYGFDAKVAGEQGHPILRSVKRHLADPNLTLESTINFAGQTFSLLDLLTGFLNHVYQEITTGVGPIDSAVIAVPAHAHGAQRLLTLEAFQQAGFNVQAMLNEPSAAGFEFTHRARYTINSKRTRILVYDLGGGTFDASLVSAEGDCHQVLASTGLNSVGGDDFDQILAQCAVKYHGGIITEDLLTQCQDAKERLSAQSKRIIVDVNNQPVIVPVDVFYAQSTPIVEETLAAMSELIGGLDTDFLGEAGVAGIYLVGGASALPTVSRQLRKRFGRRVFRSPYPGAATAIGLAIAADPDSTYALTDRLSRGFGVFREADCGRQVAFDVLLGPDLPISMREEVTVSRRYRPVHNIGHFRFIEFSKLDDHQQPRGDISPFGDVTFPFDAALQKGFSGDLAAVQISDLTNGPLIEERYSVDKHGIIQLAIEDMDTGFTMTYTLNA